MIAQWQIEQFHQQGYLVVEGCFPPPTSPLCRAILTAGSRRAAATRRRGGNPRRAAALRYRARPCSRPSVAAPGRLPDGDLRSVSPYCAQLADDDHRRAADRRQRHRFHHSKINSKLPHTATEVKWHQDFLFTPHSNDDIITALLMVSEVTPENGPLNVVPGSHQGPLWSHWQEGRFTGAVDDEVVTAHCQQPQACFGPAGSVCFMHTRLLHASSPNETALPRTLFISVYAAEDALPFGENPLPSRHAGQLVAGEESGLVRSTDNQLRLPQKPRGASFLFSRPVPIAPACNSPTLRRFYDTLFRTTPAGSAALRSGALTSLNALAFQQSGKITAGSDMTFTLTSIWRTISRRGLILNCSTARRRAWAARR